MDLRGFLFVSLYFWIFRIAPIVFFNISNDQICFAKETIVLVLVVTVGVHERYTESRDIFLEIRRGSWQPPSVPEYGKICWPRVHSTLSSFQDEGQRRRSGLPPNRREHSQAIGFVSSIAKRGRIYRTPSRPEPPEVDTANRPATKPCRQTHYSTRSGGRPTWRRRLPRARPHRCAVPPCASGPSARRQA